MDKEPGPAAPGRVRIPSCRLPRPHSHGLSWTLSPKGRVEKITTSPMSPSLSQRPRSSDGHPDSAEEGTLTELRKRPSSSGTTFPSTKFSMAVLCAVPVASRLVFREERKRRPWIFSHIFHWCTLSFSPSPCGTVGHHPLPSCCSFWGGKTHSASGWCHF